MTSVSKIRPAAGVERRLIAIIQKMDEAGAVALGHEEERYLIDELKRSLCLQNRQGKRRPETVDRMKERNQQVSDIARRFFADLPAIKKAQRVYDELRRYQTGQWRFDRKKDHCPYPTDAIRAHLWQALRSNNGKVVGASRLRKIFATAGGGDTCR